MMAFMAALLRFFVSIGIALFVIAGGVGGWFYDTAPALVGGLDVGAGPPPAGAESIIMRIVGAIVGVIVGLIAATFTFGVLALLLDIHQRLGQVSEALTGGGASISAARVGQAGRPLNYER